MSSGKQPHSPGLDRMIKLWISLWNLVLENKRHWESVCAALQHLVYEKTAWPRFKNWPLICELGRTEPLMQRVIQDLDISKINERNARIIAAFPDCFSETRVSGIPLSVIIDRIARARVDDPELADDGFEEEYAYIRRKGALIFFPGERHTDSFGFPFTFLYDPGVDLDDCMVEDGYEDAPRATCPDGISTKGGATQWGTIIFRGKPYVVFEVCQDDQRIAIVPAEYVALNL